MSSVEIVAIAELVYTDLLGHPTTTVADIAARLGTDQQAVRDAFDTLSELALVEPILEGRPVPVPVSPQFGLQLLHNRQQAALAAMQARIHTSRAVAAQIVSRVDLTRHPSTQIRHCVGVEEVRTQLALLTDQVGAEVLSLAPGGRQTEENMRASQPLSASLLGRGVQLRTIFLESIRNDQTSVDHVNWLTARGAEVRTQPTLPVRMTIVDRVTALVAVDDLDSSLGATVYTGPGIVAALCSLFELQWESAAVLGTTPPRAAEVLGPIEQTALDLLIAGNTDEVVARRLGVSTRTARRLASGLMETLDARSRFQAGAQAVYRGYARQERGRPMPRPRAEDHGNDEADT